MRVLALFLALVCPVIALAQTPPQPPVIRTSVDPSSGIVIGQPVRLDVAVLFAGEMLHPPLVSVPEAAGAQILRFETQAVTIRDRIDGQDFVGQNFEFVVFPRRGGEILVPAPVVTLRARNGDPVGSAQGTATRFSVSVPPGIDASGPVLAADSVRASESWSPEPGAKKLRIGDAIVRTIRREAAGVPALGMAEFRFEAPEGVRAYADPPVVEDRSNRGVVEGHRTDKVTYVFEKPGRFELPALIQPWWSLVDKQARTETLPGLTLEVVATTPASNRSPAWGRAAPWLLGGAGLVLALLLLRKCLRLAWSALLEKRKASESAARQRVLRIAKTGDAAKTYRALASWRARLPASGQAMPREDRALGKCISDLERNLFAGDGLWDKRSGMALAQAVSAWRRTDLSRRPAGGSLPPLNPSA